MIHMLRYLPLILKNTLRSKRRSILTILSVTMSFTLLGVLFAMYHALYFSDPTPGQALRLITRNRISLAVVMPASYKQKIQTVPGVQAVTISQWYGGQYKDQNADRRNNFARFAIEPEDFFKVHTDLTIPEEQKQAFIRERTACIVGRVLAERLGLHLGDRITLKGDIFPGTMDFILRGIYTDANDNESMYFNLEYLFQSLPAGRRDFAGMFGILARSKEDVSKVQRDVDALFTNSPAQTRTETEAAFALSFVSFLGNVKVFLLAICAAVTFTILLVSANTMAMSVRERVREVGVMKTLGFTNGGILTIILGEAVVLSVVGAALGCILATILAVGVGASAGAFIGQFRNLTLTPSTVAVILAFSVVVALLSSFVPALTAARTNILDTLKYSG
ncbi:ABC transporter permease [Bryobacter aggregatus]|uniref:ABC transporter permease n=1 Tax=Bryobacter aggregatus TaxID=360054 RepID=UPI0004E0E677|nr:FtsX-like permease family protein [Bryobacter aggregatus]